jgi:serine phosphatase RsbU (regulator of sigma subunit)
MAIPGLQADDPSRDPDGDARLVRVLEAMPSAFFSLDTGWRFTYVNTEAERLLASPRSALLGEVIWDRFPDAVGSAFEAQYRFAAETGEQATFEAYYPAPLDRWYEVRAWPSADGLSVYFLDITARRVAQERSEHDQKRARLLSAVTSELYGTLDVTAASERLAQLVVPAVCDWSVVTLVDDEPTADGSRGLRDVASWHVNEGLRAVVEQYRALRLPALSEDAYLARSFRSEQTVVVTANAAAAIGAVLRDEGARSRLEQLAPESAAFLMLRGRDRVVGGLSLFRGINRRPMAADDLALAEEIAARAGLAIDNARLFRQQQQLTEALQRSLLTAPPEPDHMQVVVRYTPAAETAQVGGDWYDAFLQADGATVLVIGDVVGHDNAAAAAMGQLRSLLRGIAAHTGDGPADVLRGVDRVMALLRVETTATAIVARVEQTDDELQRGVTHVRWSNAGHPPPMAINPDGSVVVLASIEADLLLGIDPDATRVETSLTLDRGSTLLLYTDGLVERRGQSLDEGLSQLRETLLALADQPLDDLCDQVLARMLPAHSEDDVALVAVRLHRQDQPRPAEAGPTVVPDGVPPDRAPT